MNFGSRIYKSFWLTLTLIIAFGVNACRQKGPDSQPQELKHVKFLIDWKAEPTYAGFYIAKEKGFFKQHGIDIEIVQGNGATVSAQVIGVGSEYTVGSCSGEATAIAVSKGIPVKSVAVLYPDISESMYSRADTPIRKPADMIGKRIGLISGSISVDEYRGLLAANHIDRSKIHEVSVGWDAAPLLSKKVDGLMNYEELTPVELKLQGYDIAVMRFADYGLHAYSLNIIANNNFLNSDSKLIHDIVDASDEGYKYLQEHPDDAAAIFSKLFPEKKPEYVKQSIAIVAKLVGNGQIGQQTQKGWEQTISTLQGLGLLAKPVTVSDVAASGFLLDTK
jgi:NitT/TauT family transport system substrate-binding protein